MKFELEDQLEIAFTDIKNEMDSHNTKFKVYKNVQWKFFKKVDTLNKLHRDTENKNEKLKERLKAQLEEL